LFFEEKALLMERFCVADEQRYAFLSMQNKFVFMSVLWEDSST